MSESFGRLVKSAGLHFSLRNLGLAVLFLSAGLGIAIRSSRAQVRTAPATARHGPDRIAGEVVDEAGVRLEGVNLRVEGNRITNPQREAGVVPQNAPLRIDQTINGTFDVDLMDAVSVRVWFSKSGYYGQRIIPSGRENSVTWFGKPSPAAAALMTDPAHSNPSTLRIVLERTGPTTRLINHSGQLKFNDAQTKHALTFDPARFQMDFRFLEAKAIAAESLETLPSNSIAVLPQFAADGKLDLIDVRGGNVIWTLPRKVSIAITGQGNGLIRIPVAPNINVARGMKEAPAEGYVREFVIDQSDYHPGIDLETNAPQIPFYIKIGQRYGKGEVILLSRSTIFVNMKISLQPDGSRLLAEEEVQ